MPDYFVGQVQEFEEGRCRVVQAGEREVGVFRRSDRFYAYRNVCPHQGGPVCEGMIIAKVEAVLTEDKRLIEERFSDKEMHIVCPWHGWEFDIETGRHAGDPRVGLQSYTVIQRGEEIYVVI